MDEQQAVRVQRAGRIEDGACRHLLVWRAGPGWRMAGSGVLGGGIGERHWVLNAQVRAGYGRMDPAEHLAELAAAQGLSGPGTGLMTAAEVDACTWAGDGGVTALVTTGIGVPTWAAAPAVPAPVPAPAPAVPAPAAYVPGTINILAVVPAPVSDAGLVNLLTTATEAKVQALLESGHDCSGTPSDAVCVAVRTARPGEAPEPFGGPRSHWGSRLARAVHRAVLAGARTDRERRAGWDGPPTHPATLPGCACDDVLAGEGNRGVGPSPV
ncbi:adenosylcobinamide amidohydrolase [Kitasatospora phosalacinea]|uniref:Adenosylcobinamide amidohydrolase n=1 Tax=Kitasatospora phosalacinea TaxID=2065 RepID=A0A9W6PLK8_9ACTN|nr:adenosylcobinamide amidohydrolase [Kitasatospora phosalacinea]GLW57078.1 adenosylcobinamide amidohydrolase [Kitasatospora phosalacinea]